MFEPVARDRLVRCHLRMIHIAAKTQTARTAMELYMNVSVKSSLNSDVMALSPDRFLAWRSDRAALGLIRAERA